MTDSGYYPPGAETDPNAPWKEEEIPELSFRVCISQTLSKCTNVCTNDYQTDVYADEEGCHNTIDTSETNWKEAFTYKHYTPLELINKFKDFLTQHIPDPIVDIKGFQRFKYLIEECEGWTEDETEVMKD